MTARDDEPVKKIKDAIALMKTSASAICKEQGPLFILKDIVYLMQQVVFASYQGSDELKSVI